MKEKRSLITGISGFVGSHLTDRLLKEKMRVSGITRDKRETDNLDHVMGKIQLYEIDLLNYGACERALKEIQPDYVFHLAALSSPAESFENPRLTLENNRKGQLNLLEAFRKLRLRPRTLIAGSADEYGVVKKEYLPVDEETPLSARSPYAASKIDQDFMAETYFYSYRIPVIRIRAFNHIGPRQAQKFAIPSWSRQIARIEFGKQKPVITVGNLTPERDFTDVRDMVSAYLLAVTRADPGEVYNIGSGKAIRVGDILQKLIALSRTKNIQTRQDDSLLRPVDLPKLEANPTKFQKKTGWKPLYSIDQTLKDTLDYWREKERREDGI